MSARARLLPVMLTDIPRADEQIRRTVETLRVSQFEQDPLFDAADSFRLSLCNSAVKREGAVIEAAIKDAIEQATHLRLHGIDRRLARVPDVQFELISTGWLIALEIKRSSQHDSSKVRQFRADLEAIPPILKTALPLFPAENVRFHIVFMTGAPPLRQGLRPDDLAQLYGLNIRSHILTARQRYSAAIKHVLRERGL
jgi:hypothetical protein